MRWSITGLSFGTCLAAFLVCPATVRAQNAAADFKANCMSCHTIGGGTLIGPDLKNVTQRKDRAWLSNYIRDPKAVMDSGDEYALQLRKNAPGGIIMPTLPTLNPPKITALLDLIEAESQLAKSQFAGVQVSNRPFVPADFERGRMLFTGNTRLANGGPTCISCHSVQGVGQLGGGSLGPDLTKVFERLGGRTGLATWLSAPATPTMQSMFGQQRPIDPEDVLALTAFFQQSAQTQPAAAQTGPNQIFIGMGLIGAVLVLYALNKLWSGRLTGVRRDMVEASTVEVNS